MADAATLISKVQRDIEPIEAGIAQHPFFDSVTSGRATIEGLRAIPGHQFYVMQSLVRSGERLVARFGDTPSGPFFRTALEGERAAAREVLDFARALGMSEADLRHYESRPEGFAYAAYFAWLAEQGSAAEVALASLVNLPVWGRACGRVSEGLHEYYGLGPTDTRVLDRYAGLRLDTRELTQIVQDGLDQGVPAENLARAARFVQEYEKEFWDAVSAVDLDYRAWPPTTRPSPHVSHTVHS